SVHGNEHHPSPGPGQNVAIRFCGVLAVRGKHVAEIMIEEGLALGRDRSLRNRPYDRPSKTRYQKVALGDRRPERRFHRQIPHTETTPYPRNAAVPRHFERHSHVRRWRPDWLAGVAGLELRNSETLGRGEPSFNPEMLRQQKPDIPCRNDWTSAAS